MIYDMVDLKTTVIVVSIRKGFTSVVGHGMRNGVYSIDTEKTAGELTDKIKYLMFVLCE